jgi:hypothetical protein
MTKQNPGKDDGIDPRRRFEIQQNLAQDLAPESEAKSLESAYSDFPY